MSKVKKVVYVDATNTFNLGYRKKNDENIFKDRRTVDSIDENPVIVSFYYPGRILRYKILAYVTKQSEKTLANLEIYPKINNEIYNLKFYLPLFLYLPYLIFIIFLLTLIRILSFIVKVSFLPFRVLYQYGKLLNERNQITKRILNIKSIIKEKRNNPSLKEQN